ncbi:sulfide/dihydroorotate dehydrogenase-like FAD/NAD-binding protein [Coprothermobacter platensis]|uniref:sulfide/dihydroorotate dehydrogenase-like FAD/NAD-binding protein n=1 Tax=Coprothermobacter platensis TaxID=108819 RepID=UPI00037C8BF4|nr:sulfide/dihydroorotate dehydrogenase-like FAD/NAD-binding protein [Coprothermobacter platensis]
MFEIREKILLAPQIWKINVYAPHIGSAYKPGNFVIVLPHEQGERIPLTVFEADKESITIVFQEIGKSTKYLGKLNVGDRIPDIMGPTGHPFPNENFGHVVLVGGGVGAATAVPLAKHLHSNGNHVTAILGARNKELVLFEKELGDFCNEVIVTTDDGSYGRKGVVTVPLHELLERNRIDMVLAIGPAVMMKAVAETTKPFNVKTMVSLNSIMVCGTGMCGACRVGYGDKTVLTCIEGPELDGHKVDWDTLLARLKMYKDEEAMSLSLFEKED